MARVIFLVEPEESPAEDRFRHLDGRERMGPGGA